MVGLQPAVRTGVGHLVATEPAAQVERADLLMVPARAARRPAEVLDCVVGVTGELSALSTANVVID
jgi:hypothetical protein